MGATIVAFVLVALGVWQIPALRDAWPILTVVAAALSTLLLVLFWNRQLMFGLVINALLATAALARPGWLERLFNRT